MSNQISGTILSISPITQIAGKNGMLLKRAVIVDCSRFNPSTGEKYENTPMLEFIGQQCSELDNYRNGDLVNITFDVQGTKYVDKNGQPQIFTRVRPYRIEPKVAQQIQQPQPFQAPPQQQPQYQPQGYQSNGLSPDAFFGGGNGNPPF